MKKQSDQARAWGIVHRVIIGAGVLCLAGIGIDRCSQPKPYVPSTYWKNWDSSRDIRDVKSYDYETGMVTYREYSKPQPEVEKETILLQRRTFTSPTYEMIEGKTITIDLSKINRSKSKEITLEDIIENELNNTDYYEFYEYDRD